MKKKLGRVIYIMLIFLIISSKNSFGFVKNDFKDEQVQIACWYGPSTNEVLDGLRDMGYTGDSVNKEMKIKSTDGKKTGFEIMEVNGKKYNIRIKGTPDGAISPKANGGYKYSELKELFGLEANESDLSKGYFWEANMILKADGEKRDGPTTTYPIYLKAVFTKSDADKIDDETIDDAKKNATTGDINHGIVDTIDMVKKIKKWANSLGEHPIEELIIRAQNAILALFDGLQIFINKIQTQSNYTSQDEEMLYSYLELENDGKGEDISEVSTEETKKGIGNRDQYTKVAEKPDYKKYSTYIDIDNSDYTSSLKIPVIVADFYNVATDRIDFFDANFLTGDKTKKTTKDNKKVLKHEEKSVWRGITDVVKTLTRIIIYIASAILLTLLIWHGVQVVGRQAQNNPVAMEEHKRALNNFFSSVLLLASSVIIMALCIFCSNEFVISIQDKDSYELPIRVNVDGAYSFSTTPTGYVRYMASTDNWESTSTKVSYTLLYGALVISNFIVVAFMGARVFGLWFLSILGPIFAVMSSLSESGKIRYRGWIFLYVLLSAVPVGLSIINKILIGIV